MTAGTKTIIPYQNSQTHDGTGLPGAGETVVLFSSVTAFGAKTMQNLAPQYWFSYAITPNANATGNAVNGYYSNDGGTTWVAFYASATNEPVGDGTTYDAEAFIGMFQDVKFEFANGAAAQTSFKVNMSLDSKQRAAAF